MNAPQVISGIGNIASAGIGQYRSDQATALGQDKLEAQMEKDWANETYRNDRAAAQDQYRAEGLGLRRDNLNRLERQYGDTAGNKGTVTLTQQEDGSFLKRYSMPVGEEPAFIAQQNAQAGAYNGVVDKLGDANFPPFYVDSQARKAEEAVIPQQQAQVAPQAQVSPRQAETAFQDPEFVGARNVASSQEVLPPLPEGYTWIIPGKTAKAPDGSVVPMTWKQE